MKVKALPYSAVYLRVHKWKNYWNRSIFAKLIVKIKVARFYGTRCTCLEATDIKGQNSRQLSATSGVVLCTATWWTPLSSKQPTQFNIHLLRKALQTLHECYIGSAHGGYPKKPVLLCWDRKWLKWKISGSNQNDTSCTWQKFFKNQVFRHFSVPLVWSSRPITPKTLHGKACDGQSLRPVKTATLTHNPSWRPVKTRHHGPSRWAVSPSSPRPRIKSWVFYKMARVRM